MKVRCLTVRTVEGVLVPGDVICVYVVMRVRR